jgi:hypothetical protein
MLAQVLQERRLTELKPLQYVSSQNNVQHPFSMLMILLRSYCWRI